MKYRVIEMRRQGARLTRDELAAAPVAEGDLVIDDWVVGNSERRALRHAKLESIKSTFPYGLLVTLFEPTVVKMTSRWMVLRGWQIDVIDGQARQYAQEWLVRPLEG